MRFLSFIICAALIQACSPKGFTFVTPPSISSFTSSLSSIFSGETTTLIPVFSDGTAFIDHDVGPVISGMAYSVSPLVDTTYTLTATNAAGTDATADLAIQVDTTPVIISMFAPSSSQVNYGEPSILSWTVAGRATRLMLDEISVLGESSRTVTPVRRQTYVLAGSNPVGGQTRTLSVAARGLDLLAGTVGGPGSIDGTGNHARFYNPAGVGVDGDGNVYVGDTANHTIRRITPEGVVTTFAGLPGSPGSADGRGTARFFLPGGVAVDRFGNTYVADTGNHTIRQITSGRVVTTFAGSPGMRGSADGPAADARFRSPTGVAVDATGTVYVADTGNHTIRVISAGQVRTWAGLAGTRGAADGLGNVAGFSSPAGVAVDGTGAVYVADTSNHTIRKIVPEGLYGRVFTWAGAAGVSGHDDGLGTTARFAFPHGVAVDGSGSLYVSDSNNRTVRRVVPEGPVGRVATWAGSAIGPGGSADGIGSDARFVSPQGVATDGSNNVYVTDANNHTIRKITPAGLFGAVSTFAGSAPVRGIADGTGSNARFAGPLGIATDASGNVYVADTENHTIRRITPAGVVSTIAGSPGAPDTTDGAGSDARFNFPAGIAVDGSGNLYVSDKNNHTIRKLVLTGAIWTVSTWAGLGRIVGFDDGTGSAARFRFPQGIGVDPSGAVYVADTDNQIIRKIVPDGALGRVSTWAGSARMANFADGTGSAARFNEPTGLAVDGSGNVYIGDSYNHAIRKVIPAGQEGTVSTLAGSTTPGFANGTGSAARFTYPTGVTVDDSGNLYVADTVNHAIRKVVPAGLSGTVTTISGSPQPFGISLGPLPATLAFPIGTAITPAGDLIITSSNGVLQVTAF